MNHLKKEMKTNNSKESDNNDQKNYKEFQS